MARPERGIGRARELLQRHDSVHVDGSQPEQAGQRERALELGHTGRHFARGPHGDPAAAAGWSAALIVKILRF